MPNYDFVVNFVAAVRVQASDEKVASNVVRTVVTPPSDLEITLVNDNNFALGIGAKIILVDFDVGRTATLREFTGKVGKRRGG